MRLKTLSPEAAASLATQKGTLFFELKSIPADTASALAKHEGKRLGLPYMTSISSDVAEALAMHEGDLCLDGLTTVSFEVAAALAKHKGKLFLEKLQTLTPEAAESLRRNPSIVLPSKFR